MKAFLELEDPIHDLARMAGLGARASMHVGEIVAVDGIVKLSSREREDLLFVIDDLQRRIEALQTAYYAAMERVREAPNV